MTAAFRQRSRGGLLYRANAIRLAGAALLSRAGVVAVPAAVSGGDIRESRPVAIFVHIHAIAHRCAVLDGISEDPHDRAGSDIDDVINRTTSLREASQVAYEEAETLLAAYRSRRNTRVQTQQIRDRTGIIGTATRTNRSRVLDQRKQIRTRSRRDRNVQD